MIQVTFRNCASFIKCITEINGATIDDAEDLDLVMSMYDLIEYSPNYSSKIGSFWFYAKDEATDFDADFRNIDAFNSFKYKTKLLGNSCRWSKWNLTVSLKCLSNFG